MYDRHIYRFLLEKFILQTLLPLSRCYYYMKNLKYQILCTLQKPMLKLNLPVKATSLDVGPAFITMSLTVEKASPVGF